MSSSEMGWLYELGDALRPKASLLCDTGRIGHRVWGSRVRTEEALATLSGPPKMDLGGCSACSHVNNGVRPELLYRMSW